MDAYGSSSTTLLPRSRPRVVTASRANTAPGGGWPPDATTTRRPRAAAGSRVAARTSRSSARAISASASHSSARKARRSAHRARLRPASIRRPHPAAGPRSPGGLRRPRSGRRGPRRTPARPPRSRGCRWCCRGPSGRDGHPAAQGVRGASTRGGRRRPAHVRRTSDRHRTAVQRHDPRRLPRVTTRSIAPGGITGGSGCTSVRSGRPSASITGSRPSAKAAVIRTSPRSSDASPSSATVGRSGMR